MFASLKSFGLCGIDAFTVSVEVDLARGIPAFEIIGLPDAAVKESRDRVKAAFSNCGYTLPLGRIVVNLAPADIRKEGSVYDAAIMCALLSLDGTLSTGTEDCAFIGELSLDGCLRGARGVLPMVAHAASEGIRRVYLPYDNRAEASVIQGVDCYPVKHISEIIGHLQGRLELKRAADMRFEEPSAPLSLDFADVKGQLEAKHGLEIAAAGGHNLLMIGPPGSGKSMLAKRLPSILPPMTFEEALECTKIHSVSGLLGPGQSLVRQRPFRSPHHTVSGAGLCGGGSNPMPGEISLAHQGVLFLDELPEFSTSVLEALRQPLEDGSITISRAKSRVSYPARVILIAAMNPCPCGYYGSQSHQCTCSPQKIDRYLGKISGPLLDRIDLHVEVPAVEYEQLSSRRQETPSAEIRQRVVAARKIQQKRFAGLGIHCNADIPAGLLAQCCPMTPEADRLLHQAFDRLGLSGRAYDRILKVSRTIADLKGEEVISPADLSEAIQFRGLDRKYWHRG